MSAADVEVHEPREHPLSEFFDGLRQSRREERGEPGSTRAAVMTLVRDEKDFFPVWLDYYSRHFAPEDIHVLDHGSTDGSTDRDGFVRIPVESETTDNRWMLEQVQGLQSRLLESYDAVLVADVDEIIVPDPDLGELRDYVTGFSEGFVNCLGYEVLHLPEREPPIDFSRPLMPQRSYWFAAEGYDKPALATEPVPYEIGRHSRTDGKLNLDPDLRLIHLHRVDHDLCLARHRERAGWFSAADRKAGYGAHIRVAADDAFERWYYTEGCFSEASEIVVERIPERWRGVF